MKISSYSVVPKPFFITTLFPYLGITTIALEFIRLHVGLLSASKSPTSFIHHVYSKRLYYM